MTDDAPTFTIRQWRETSNRRHVVTVVDHRGELVHVMIPFRHTDAGSARHIIEHALAGRPAPPAPFE